MNLLSWADETYQPPPVGSSSVTLFEGTLVAASFEIGIILCNGFEVVSDFKMSIDQWE